VGRRSGLGRGLGALIPNADAGSADDSVLRELPIALVRPNRYQPRAHFDDEALSSLAASVRELGVLQPVLVRPVDDHFELVAGERRWRAAQLVGLTSIPALVREVGDTNSLEQALVENLHREDLSPLEEAAAFQQLVDDFQLSYEQVGQRVGKGRSTVANAIRLLQLPPSIQKLVNEKALAAGHARALLSLESADLQELLAERVVSEELSVRATEEAVRHIQAKMAEAEAGGDAPAAPDAPADPDATKLGERPPGVYELEEALSEHLDTRVQIVLGGKQRGKITLTFAGYDDLERICRVITDGREPAL
jgi:ParB family transcriptional regulator, chromosome partitioning protein